MMNDQFDMWEYRARLSLIALRGAMRGKRRNTILYEAMRLAGLLSLLWENTKDDYWLEAKMFAQDGEFEKAAEYIDKAWERQSKPDDHRQFVPLWDNMQCDSPSPLMPEGGA